MREDLKGKKPCIHKKTFFGMVDGRCIKCGGYISSLGKSSNIKTKKKPCVKKRIVELYIEKSKRFGGWQQLVARDIDGSEYIIVGSYCGGIPESHWEKVKALSPERKQTEIKE